MATDSTAIPVIDISASTPAGSACAQIDAACRSIGFFAVTGHGVAGQLLDCVLDVTREFFAQPKYATTTAGAYLQSRFDETFAYRQ